MRFQNYLLGPFLNIKQARRVAPLFLFMATNEATHSPKRKAEDAPEHARAKQTKKAPSLVTLKNTRLSLRQKAVGWDRTMPVLRAVLAFQSFFSDNQTHVLMEIPTEHLGVIASLAQESDKNETELAKRIHATLLPEGSTTTIQNGENVDVLSVTTIQKCLNHIAARVNYGIDQTGEETVPASLQLWRWEVHDMSLLPKENLDKLVARRQERVQAKEEALQLFEALPQEKQQSLLSPKKPPRTKTRAVELDPPSEDAAPPPSSSPVHVDMPEESPKPTPVPREKSERTKLRESRRAERQAREERQEKDKQAQVRLFNAFFQQPVAKSVSKKDEEKNKTDFELTFPPCEYKDVAEPNQFYHPVDDTFLQQLDARNASPQVLLAEFQQAFRKRSIRQTSSGIHPPVCVRDIMKTVTESDVLGGNAEEQAKRSLEKLNDRRLVPIKLLQFHLERRPGWVGTNTRSSNFITPRRPFGQDPLSIDYTFDSDAEWEDVDEGENVDDAMDDREEEAESVASSEEDSELDDWLEDDLEEEDAAPMEEDTVSSSRSALVRESPLSHKTKKKLKLLGRRFDSKLVPYITGPHWETTLSAASYESFEPYQVRLLNEAHVGLNPFTFVSTTMTIADDDKSSDTIPQAATTSPESSTLQNSVPPRTTKFLFPDTHMPELVSKIHGSTRSKPALIEDLWEYFAPSIKGVSKAAIESRLQECAIRESKKPGAKWIIKEDSKHYMAP